jgi:hypothetical protein
MLQNAVSPGQTAVITMTKDQTVICASSDVSYGHGQRVLLAYFIKGRGAVHYSTRLNRHQAVLPELASTAAQPACGLQQPRTYSSTAHKPVVGLKADVVLEIATRAR